MGGKFVDVTLRLIDKVTSPLNGIGSKLTDSSKQWRKAGRQIEQTGKSITNVGSGLTKTVTAPIAALGTSSVMSFGEVDKSLKLVESTMGQAKWKAGDLEKAIKTSASGSVFFMKNAADATLNFARQGFDAKEAADMLKPSLSLAAGTATDLEKATYGLGNTLKVFAGQGLTAQEAADVFAAAQAQANTTTNDLFEAMEAGASIFNTVGWSMQDLAAVTGVFGDNFISGSEGATAMKTGLARLISPTDEAASWIEKLGLEFINADGTMKSMTETHSLLNKSFAGLTQEQQMQAASALFGKNQMGKWLTLINTAPDTVQKYRNSLDDVTGTADNMADSLLSGVGGSIEKMKSTFDVFKYNIGSTMGDSAQIVIDKITSIIDAFNNMDPSVQKNIVKFALMAAAVGPSIMMFGKMVKSVGKITTTIGNFGLAIKKAGSLMALITSPAGIVIMVLGALVAVTVLLIKNWDKIKPVVQKVFGYVKQVFKEVGITSDSMKEKMEPIGAKLANIGEHALKLWKTIQPPLGKIADIFKFVFQICLGSVIGIGIGLLGSFLSSVTKISKSLLKIFDGIIVFLTGVFTGSWKKALEGIKEIFSGVFELLAGIATSKINAIIGIVNGAISGINKLNVSIPDWVPVVGGKKFSINIPKIPQLAKGTDNWKGGLVQISEKGGEIVDLPSGSRVYPHDKSVEKAYKDGAKSSGNIIINIPKLADEIIIREESDIDRIAEKLADKIEKIKQNLGGEELEYNY